MATAGSTLSQLDRAEGSQAFSDALSAGVRTRSEWLAASTADRLTNQHRPSLPLVPMAGPKDGSQ